MSRLYKKTAQFIPKSIALLFTLFVYSLAIVLIYTFSIYSLSKIIYADI
mgnify:CR=1 FL=1